MSKFITLLKVRALVKFPLKADSILKEFICRVYSNETFYTFRFDLKKDLTIPISIRDITGEMWFWWGRCKPLPQ